MNEEERFTVFAVIWTILLILIILFQLRGSPEFKIKWFPRLYIFIGALFVIIGYWATQIVESLYITMPAALLSTLLNIKCVKYCPVCGGRNLILGRGIYYCAKCQTKLLDSTISHE